MKIRALLQWIELPFRLLWNLAVFATAVGLTIAWLIFIFGSVLGVVLLLIFFPGAFLLPMCITALCVELFPVTPWWED
jgi:hypothetical protein